MNMYEDWSYCVPKCWHDIFFELCKELEQFGDKLIIYDVKEKYELLRVYIGTKEEDDPDCEILDAAADIIDKYTELTRLRGLK